MLSGWKLCDSFNLTISWTLSKPELSCWQVPEARCESSSTHMPMLHFQTAADCCHNAASQFVDIKAGEAQSAGIQSEPTAPPALELTLKQALSSLFWLVPCWRPGWVNPFLPLPSHWRTLGYSAQRRQWVMLFEPGSIPLSHHRAWAPIKAGGETFTLCLMTIRPEESLNSVLFQPKLLPVDIKRGWNDQ